MKICAEIEIELREEDQKNIKQNEYFIVMGNEDFNKRSTSCSGVIRKISGIGPDCIERNTFLKEGQQCHKII